jgi:type III pantothenate kinase
LSNLLLDIGNSRLKWALQQGEEFVATGGFPLDVETLESELAAVEARVAAPAKVVVSNVAGPIIAELLTHWATQNWGVSAQFILAQRQEHGVTNAYAEPHKLGVDRWAALIGAKSLGAGPMCVVDCGSAITVDALDQHGQHLGGSILPGLVMMHGVLADQTHALEFSDDTLDQPVELLAKTTQQAILGGTTYAAAAFIDRAFQQVEQKLNAKITGLITGGDAERILPLLDKPFRYEPQLVLRGLAVIAGAS